MHSAAQGLTDVICFFLHCPDFLWELGEAVWNFTHLMKIILVFKTSLKTLHFGIHKEESHRRSLVASVVYFSQNTDVLFAVFQSWAIQTPCCWALALCAVSSGSFWWRPLGLYDLFFLSWWWKLWVLPQLRSLLVLGSVLQPRHFSCLLPWSLTWLACVLKKNILRIKVTHFAFRS